MDNAVMIRENTNMVTGMPSQQELLVYQTWAKNAADSQMYRNVGKESGIMMIMLAAREYNIGPAQALNGGLHIIEGKVELSARVMSALIRRSKHTLRIVESTDTKCTIYGKRKDTDEEHTVTFTIDMAQKAGLIKDKGGWKRTPEDMLFARALSRLARQLFSDVIGIGYIEGEISDSRPNNEVLEVLQPFAEAEEVERCRNIIFNNIQDDPNKVKEYILAFSKHFKCSVEDSIISLSKDPEQLKIRFNQWKERNNEKVITIDTSVNPTE